MTSSSYSDKKMFFITFLKTLRKNAAQGVLLTLFWFVSLNTGTAERYFSLLWDSTVEYEPMLYCIGGRWPDVVYVGFSCLVFGLSAIMTALGNFKFMHAKKTVNVYYSLGVKRSTLFAGTFAGCVATFVYSIFIPFLLCAAFNCYLFGNSLALWKAIAYYAFSFLAVSLYPLAMSVLCMTCSGTTVEGNICGTVLTFAPTFLYYGVYMLSDLLLAGANYDIYLQTMDGNDRITAEFGGRFQFLDFLHPVTNGDFADALVARPTDVSPLPSVMYPIFYLGLFVVLTLVARHFFIRKKTEKAGFLGADTRLLAITVFALASILIPFASLIAYGNAFTPAGSVVIAILLIGVAFGVYIGFVAVFLRSKQKVKDNLRKGYIMMAALFVFLLIFITGGFGYETRIPDSEKVVRAGISFSQGRGAVSNDTSFGFVGEDSTLYDHYPPAAHGKALLQSIMYTQGLWGENCFVFFDGDEEIETVRSIHEMLLDEPKNRRSSWSESIVVSYELANGHTLTRVYPVATVEVMIEMQKLLNTQNYREACAQYIAEFLQFNNRNAVIFSKNCTAMTDVNKRQERADYEKQDQLYRALIADIQNGALPMDFVSDDTPLGYIGITRYDSSNEVVYQKASVDYLPYSADYIMIPVYPSMKQTLAVLEKYELLQYFEDIRTPVAAFVYASPFNEKSEEAILYYDLSSLQFEGFVADRGYHGDWPFVGLEDDVSYRLPPDCLTVTDAQVIEELTENTVFASFVNQPGYFVELRYTDEAELRTTDALVYVPYDKMPAALK